MNLFYFTLLYIILLNGFCIADEYKEKILAQKGIIEIADQKEKSELLKQLAFYNRLKNTLNNAIESLD